MIVREINPRSKGEVKKFIEFPFELYKDSDFWVPFMESDVKAAFDAKMHPFYRHSTAAFFVVESGTKRLAQVAVMHNRRYNEFHKKKTALFYYFDSVDDVEAVELLFEAASCWARRRFLSEITGPLGFHALDGRGVLVEGFHRLPATGIPYNHPYYDFLLSAAGFEKKSDFLSGILKYQDFSPRFYRIKNRGGERFQVKSFSGKRELLSWTEKMRWIYNQTFTELIDHYPMSREEMDFTAARLIDIADPRLIKIVMKGENPAGFILVYPNIVRGIKKVKGKIFPFGWFHLLKEMRKTRRVDFNGVAMLPEYRGRGGNAVLYSELKKSLEDFRFEEGEVVQIEEGNGKSLGEIGMLNVDWCKRHRIYSKSL
ncbi:MAG: hypothetical protein PHF07_02300 [Candidatus Pacebacteria bacterium]|jgi:hypothetical protein|nr:hypothetical protein [Candidatus Paceibacterota bacterium]